MKGARNYTYSAEHGLPPADCLTFRLLELLRSSDFITLVCSIELTLRLFWHK